HLIDSLPILARRAAGDPAGFAVRDAGRGEVYAWREGEAARRMPAADLAKWLPAGARVMVEPAGMLAQWLPELAHLEVPATDRRRPREPAGQRIRACADGGADSAGLSTRLALAHARGATLQRRRRPTLREVRFQGDRSSPRVLHRQ